MMKENTFAVSLTLEDLKRRRLVIPCFQRPYRWTRDEAAVLFDDLMAFQEVAKLDSSIRYSLGTIVTARLDPRGEELFVLDGQQRLTTVALLENVLESHLDKEMADEKAPLPPKWLSYRNLPEGASFPGRWKKAGRNDNQALIFETLKNDNQALIFETLKIQGMMKNHHLAKAIADAGWAEFMRQCEYKAKHEGRIFAKIGTFYPSSKTCSACGHKLKELSLATRSWTCPHCGAHHDRDLNASLNIKQEGIRMLKAAGLTVLRS